MSGTEFLRSELAKRDSFLKAPPIPPAKDKNQKKLRKPRPKPSATYAPSENESQSEMDEAKGPRHPSRNVPVMETKTKSSRDKSVQPIESYAHSDSEVPGTQPDRSKSNTGAFRGTTGANQDLRKSVVSRLAKSDIYVPPNPEDEAMESDWSVAGSKRKRQRESPTTESTSKRANVESSNRNPLSVTIKPHGEKVSGGKSMPWSIISVSHEIKRVLPDIKIRRIFQEKGNFTVIPNGHRDSIDLIHLRNNAPPSFSDKFEIIPPDVYRPSKPREYEVIIRGVDTNLEELDVTDELKHGGYSSIVRVRRFIKNFEGVQKKLPLISVVLSNMQEASRLLDNGCFMGYNHCRTEFPKSTTRVDRCYKCQNFGHFASSCTKNASCAICASPTCITISDRSARCPDRPMCVNCGGEHPSLSRKCPKQIERVKFLEEQKKKEPSNVKPSRMVTSMQKPATMANVQASQKLTSSDMATKIAHFCHDLITKTMEMLIPVFTNPAAYSPPDSDKIATMIHGLAMYHLRVSVQPSSLVETTDITTDPSFMSTLAASLGAAPRSYAAATSAKVTTYHG